jgi:hypothetical protein
MGETCELTLKRGAGINCHIYQVKSTVITQKDEVCT